MRHWSMSRSEMVYDISQTVKYFRVGAAIESNDKRENNGGNQNNQDTG